MTQQARDAFLIALISLLIITTVLLLANFSDEHTGKLVGIVLAMCAIGMAFVIATYKLRKAEIDADKEIALADMGALRQRSEEPRIVAYNSLRNKVVSPDVIRLTETLALPKQDVIDFVAESLRDGGIGLAISRWKNDFGWDQEKLERLLDFMSDVGIVTRRENGRACQYVREFGANEVLRIIANNSLS